MSQKSRRLPGITSFMSSLKRFRMLLFILGPWDCFPRKGTRVKKKACNNTAIKVEPKIYECSEIRAESKPLNMFAWLSPGFVERINYWHKNQRAEGKRMMSDCLNLLIVAVFLFSCCIWTQRGATMRKIVNLKHKTSASWDNVSFILLSSSLHLSRLRFMNISISWLRNASRKCISRQLAVRANIRDGRYANLRIRKAICKMWWVASVCVIA